MNSYVAYPNVDIDRDEDVIVSIRRWLNHLFPTTNILLERTPANFVRPSFKIEVNNNVRNEQLTPVMWESVRRAHIRYAAANRVDASNALSEVRHYLELKRRRMPHIMGNWRYPNPTLRSTPGSLAAGTYYVAVSAKNILNQYSLVSNPVAITVAANNDIIVLIPMMSGGEGYFKEFTIYMGTAANVLHQHSIVTVNVNQIVTQAAISALPVGVITPPISSEIEYRFYKIGQVEGNYVEDPLKSGAWDVDIGFEMRFTNLRHKDQHVSMAAVHHNVGG